MFYEKIIFLFPIYLSLKTGLFALFAKGCFQAIMKNHPLEAKLNWPKREEQICKYSKRTHLLCFSKAFFCNFTNFSLTPSRGNETVYRYNTSSLVIFDTVWLLSGPEVERRFVFHVTDFIFIPASTPVGVGSILINDNIFILIFLIMSIAFVMIEQFSFVYHVTVHVLSKLKWQRRHLKNNHWFDWPYI